MTPLQEEWILALESGKYRQAQGKLKKEEGFCCLGVACDLMIKKAPVSYSWDSASSLVIDGERNVFSLPDRLIARFKLSEEIVTDVMRMNDIQEKSFKEIAAYLRSVL